MSNARRSGPSQRIAWWMRPGPEALLGEQEPVARVADEVLLRHPHVAVDDLGVAAVGRRPDVGWSMVGMSRTMSTPGVSVGTMIIEEPWYG